MANGSERSNGIGTLLVIGLIGSAIYLGDWSSFSSEINEWPMLCSAAVVGDQCSGNEYRLPNTVYKVYTDQQNVVFQTDGQIPVRLTNCAIIDRENWRCDYEEWALALGFNAGHYWQGVQDEKGIIKRQMSPNIWYSSRWRWRLAASAPKKNPQAQK